MVDKNSTVKNWESKQKLKLLAIEHIPDLNEEHIPRIVEYLEKKFDMTKESSLLPLQIFILSKIKDLSKIIFTEEEQESHFISTMVTREQIQELNYQWGIDVVAMVENAMIQEVSNRINEQIEQGKIAHVEILAERVSLISVAQEPPRVRLESKITFV